MKRNTTYFFLSILITLLLSGCSTAALQTSRLDTAEEYIVQAEQAIGSSPNQTQIIYATESLGTANAYLATLKDNKKHLSKQELERFKALKLRAKNLQNRIQ